MWSHKQILIILNSHHYKVHIPFLRDLSQLCVQVKVVLVNQNSGLRKISLKKGDELISEDTVLANARNKHFIKSVTNFSEKGRCSD